MYLISSIIAKTIHKLIKVFKFGSGNTWPGHIILKLYPGILRELSQNLPKNIILVSGTNGKTTTVKLIAYLLKSEGKTVIYNKSGANLVNGIISSILVKTKADGSLPYDFAVFELDELALPRILEEIAPSAIVLLNLSRDQLDRHWEVDLIFEKWQEALRKVKDKRVLVLEEDSDQLKKLQRLPFETILKFSSEEKYLKKATLQGEFNAKNMNAALTTLSAFGFSREKLSEYLKDFEPAYGRGEMLSYQGVQWKVLLAKNPASMNENLQLLKNDSASVDSFLFVLNDNIPDGHDVSWIYDVNPEYLRQVLRGKEIYLSGVRAYDMAIRLKYTGVEIKKENIEPDLQLIIEKITKKERNKNVVVLPNYSAMLEFRKVVLGKSIL